MKDRTSTATSGLILVGVVVLIVGVLSGVGLWYSAGQRHEDAVRNLARAPVGCVTTLDFAETGRYLLFIETRGEISDVVGDCGEPGEFEWTESRQPSADVTLTDPEGGRVGLDSAGGVSYDASGSNGRVVQSFRIDIPGDHLLTVADGPPGFAFAVGRDPHDGVTLLRAGAGLAVAAGVIIAGAMFVLASRRTGAQPAPGAAAGPWMHTPPGRAPSGPGSPPGLGSPAGWEPVTQPPIRPPVSPPTRPIPGQPPLVGGPGQTGPPSSAGGSAGGWTGEWGRPSTGAPSADGAGRSGDGSSGGRSAAHGSSDDGSTDDGSTGDGSSGDGERSPWSPPADRQ